MQDINNEKPSERIKYAIEALQEVRAGKHPWIIPNMDVYHHPTEDNKYCYACLGGIAAIKRYNLTLEKIVDYWIDFKTQEKFGGIITYLDSVVENLGLYEQTLDKARKGLISYMFLLMDLPETDRFDRRITSYEEDPEKFINELLQLATTLEEAGY